MTYAVDVRNQLEGICRKCKLTTATVQSTIGTESGLFKKMKKMTTTEDEENDWVDVRKCLLLGYYDNVAQLQKDNTYLTLASRQRAKIHPSSVLHGKERPELLFYTEFLSTGQNYLKLNTVVEAKWLLEMPQLRKHFGNFL